MSILDYEIAGYEVSYKAFGETKTAHFDTEESMIEFCENLSPDTEFSITKKLNGIWTERP